MYSLGAYASMLADRVRTGAYERALRQTLKPGMVVMEIGTGPGAMAVLACKIGASRVYAVESSPVIQVAREIAAANHCADKITFLEDLSTKITLPAKADVIISDLHGILPFLDHHIPSIADARRRFLAPGGTLIGREDRIWAAVVEAPKHYAKIVEPWERNIFGQDLNPARRMSLNTLHGMHPAPEQLLTNPQLWVTLDYTTIENPDVQGVLNWTVIHDGTGHGIVVWFDADLAEGVSFSNAPGSPAMIYGSMYLPWLDPVPLKAGQTVRVDLQAKLLEMDYFWRWVSRIEVPGRPGEIATQFDQSQLKGMLLSPEKLRKSTSTYVPELSKEGLLRRRTLDLMDGRASLEDIARRLTIEFPERFARWQQALSFAGELSKENSR
jgi:protein arginine N-methyltransferase 1